MLYQKILFLCSGNYYRSRFAEELFNHRAKAEATCWRAISRGLALDRSTENVGPLSYLTVQALADRQITPLERLPLACSLQDLESAAMVVAMKEAEHRLLLRERFPGWENRVSYWHVHDIDAGEASDAITSMDRLVTELLASCRSRQR
jgi:protein-tyrosine phosphatase